MHCFQLPNKGWFSGAKLSHKAESSSAQRKTDKSRGRTVSRTLTLYHLQRLGHPAETTTRKLQQSLFSKNHGLKLRCSRFDKHTSIRAHIESDMPAENMSPDEEQGFRVSSAPDDEEEIVLAPKNIWVSADDPVSVAVSDAETELPSSSGRRRNWVDRLLGTTDSRWNLEGTKGGIAGLFLGQALSLLVTATGLTSALLAQKGNKPSIVMLLLMKGW
jgi:hypothetical protein